MRSWIWWSRFLNAVVSRLEWAEVAMAEVEGVDHLCHEGRCTHRKVCREVVGSLGNEMLSTQAARAGVGRGGRGQYGNIDATLTWKDLNVTVSDLKRKRRTVLFNASGYAEPGKVMAIMGPSGSGKSTLLDALAGYSTTSLLPFLWCLQLQVYRQALWDDLPDDSLLPLWN